MVIKEYLEKLYDEYYMTATGLDKFYIRETVALNITGGYDTGYSGIQKMLKKKELKKILGICAAWWRDKKYNDTYVNELLKIRYRMGVIQNAQSN